MIADRIKQVKENIANACISAGRKESEVTLIAVTKTRTVDEINEAVSCGIDHIGENRVNELNGKIPYLDKNIHLHLIGALQTNKVKQVLGKVELIHSLDRLSLAEEIEKQAQKLSLPPINVLVEVNIAGETTKSGVFANNLTDFLDILTNFRYINPIGLMTVAPAVATEYQQEEYFAQMREFLDVGKKKFGQGFSELSMGMSRDYTTAIKHGATMVRIGTSIFGERNYNLQEDFRI